MHNRPRVPSVFVLEKILKNIKYIEQTGELISSNKSIGTRRPKTSAIMLTDENSKDIYLRSHHICWFIKTGQWPKFPIDHIDRNPVNNKWENLREDTKGQNAQNHKLFVTNTTGITGVSKNKSKYIAYITVKRKRIHLGSFLTIEEATSARADAECQLHGEFGASA
jgi:hypothetical protein